jgi:hypothetical protein
MRVTGPTAAIAGIHPGVQCQGVWTGRRQLLVRFAGEAETAMLYTAEMLTRQIAHAVEQSPLHSISFAGSDPLASAELIAQILAHWHSPVPVMLDCDGQRPEAIPEVAAGLAMVQVTYDFGDAPASGERVLASLAAAARAERAHAAVLAPRDGTSDGQILRFVEQTHATAPGTKIVVHPGEGAMRASLDRRYATLLERAMAIHHDTMLLMRIPAPVGAR